MTEYPVSNKEKYTVSGIYQRLVSMQRVRKTELLINNSNQTRIYTDNLAEGNSKANTFCFCKRLSELESHTEVQSILKLTLIFLPQQNHTQEQSCLAKTHLNIGFGMLTFKGQMKYKWSCWK